MKCFKQWYARWFKVIGQKQAEEWNLTFFYNVYGDPINSMNCRSVWRDSKNRYYRVCELNLNT